MRQPRLLFAWHLCRYIAVLLFHIFTKIIYTFECRFSTRRTCKQFPGVLKLGQKPNTAISPLLPAADTFQRRYLWILIQLLLERSGKVDP